MAGGYDKWAEIEKKTTHTYKIKEFKMKPDISDYTIEFYKPTPGGCKKPTEGPDIDRKFEVYLKPTPAPLPYKPRESI